MQYAPVHFLLVHGTTQSPDGWRLLIDELVAIGHTAETTDLLRFGEAATSTEYGQAVAAELSGPKVDVVVAHSGSGLLLPAIAISTRAAVQVYLAAFIPNGSASLMEEVDDDASKVFNDDWIGVDPTANPQDAHHFLFHDCSPAVEDWAVHTLRPFLPASVYSERVSLAPSVPAMAIAPEHDRTLRPEWMIVASRERLGVEAIVVPGGHCAHVSRPRDIAAILAAAPT